MDDVKIVVLDGYTANPGDLSWAALSRLGRCEVYHRTNAAELEARCQQATVIVTNKVAIQRPLLEQCPQLRGIAVMATGYDMVDVEAAREHQIHVQNVPAYSTDSVAQLVFAHLLNLVNRTADHARLVRSGRWAKSPDWCFWDFPQIELAGLTMGIVGWGKTGRAVGRIAEAFGMHLLVTTRTVRSEESVRFVDLPKLLSACDVVSLHCPLTEETRHLINAESLAHMKSTSFLINTGRGPLVDSAALAAAIRTGRIAGAGIDVLEQEPPPPDHPLTNLDECFVTPHIAWATNAARSRLMEILATNVDSLLQGDPHNVVNPW